MLGAVKGDAQANVSLFRLLSRRWSPLAPVKRKRTRFSAGLGAENDGQPAKRAWIGAKRQTVPLPGAADANAKTSKSSWNPWQLLK
jgi:hypothetical protein